MKTSIIKSGLNALFIVLLAGAMVIALPSCENKTAKYNAKIASADSALNAKKYNSAIALYKDAKVIKPEEKYPDDQINKIKNILKQMEDDRKYNETIKRADDYFETGDYERARSDYRAAASLKPGESYPNQKIKEINEILEKQKAKMAAENNPYHIVVGSFEQEAHATKLHDQLENMGYHSHLIPRFDDALTAVTIKSFPDLHAAWNALPKIRNMEMFQDDSPWIVKYTIKK